MEFTDLLFLYLVLPVAILIYFLLPGIRKKNMALLVISLLLYAMGNPLLMALMVLWSYFNYKLALRIDPEDRATIVLPVAMNVCILFALRYLDYLLSFFGWDNFRLLGKLTGISLYSISVVSYFLDIYQDRIDPEEKLSNFLLYLMMFPKMIMGPIVRYEEISLQLTTRQHSPRAVFEGLRRFAFGLAKKVLLADYCGRLLAQVNASGLDAKLVGVWFTAILYMFQIYYAFSGYSDMAIGLGRIFGFRFRENFKRPYRALSAREFWDRWHISLNGFFQDYVYIPLGGDKLGKSRQILNMLIVCVLTGLWYGPGLNCVLWGLYFFLVFLAEDQFTGTLENLPDWACRGITLWLVLVGWIIFSNDNLQELKEAFLAVLGYGKFAAPELWVWILNSLPMLIVCGVGCTRFPVAVKRVFDRLCGMDRRKGKIERVTTLRLIHTAVSLAVMVLLFWVCTVSLSHYPDTPTLFVRF